ncbi:Yqey-like protein-domain-containing protein [Leucosporidium creatinivorum]|uniref:Altered inheritance of mitochondria protein 41 n=1 Tax=Leucosporidium creatinivorum TaxID=106004 RepID=A0A1Y2FZ08_9BASI|nr:Yqey-like protein-domain-containing protein [Leucosporidium creatinivorum]
MFRFAPSLRIATRPATALRLSSTAAAPDPLVVSLRAALKEHMKARAGDKVSVIKSVLSDIQNLQHTASPPPPSKILNKAITARLDAASTFSSATPPRADLAEQYRAEAAVLQAFVPEKAAGMGAEELAEAVQKVVKELGLEKVTGKEMGKVVKAVLEAVAGKAGGKEVSEAVKKLL